MGDITCRQCGEPWDAYGVHHGDMDLAEARKFLAGKGCPACHFGSSCVHCHGTGREPSASILLPDCKPCRGSRYLIARRLAGERWTYGYLPDVRELPDQEPTILVDYGWAACLEGRFQEVMIACPFCLGEPCSVCQGSGKLVRREEDNLRWLVSLAEEAE